MDSQFAVIPAAIGLMLGPPILSAVMLATSKRARANSFVFIVGIVLGSTVGMTIAYFASTLIEEATDDLEQGDNILVYLVVLLLVILIIRTFLKRKTAEPPKWMGTLQDAEPRFAFKIGALLSMLTPANIIILFSAGAYLVDNDLPFRSSFILIAVTTLIAAIPIAAHVALGSKADDVMPAVRDWMNNNSWLISIIVYVFFIYAMLS